MRVFIVEDVPLARDRIRLFLADEPDVEVVGETGSIRSAITSIPALTPDLVLLDVRLPDGEGFEVLRQLPADVHPLVVFLTAHEEHALAAFDVNAIDYVLKPVSRQRLQRALVRARVRLSAQSRGTLDTPSSASSPSRLAINGGNGIELIDVSGILHAKADGHYVHLHTTDGTYLLRTRLSALAKQLDPALFARIHRSHLVRLDQVKRLHPRRNGDCDLILRDGTELSLSRTYREGVEKKLGIGAASSG